MPELVVYLLIFLGVGVFFVLFHLLMGKLIRPSRPSPEKLTIYECGEPTIGSAWIQFDLRFYVVALLFVIFEVEAVFFFPWAVVFGKATSLASLRPAAVEARPGAVELSPADVDRKQRLTAELIPADVLPPGQSIDASAASRLAWLAVWDIMLFFGILLVGFFYLWKRGDLDWVRSTLAERSPETNTEVSLPEVKERQLVGA